jgi:tRNA pseudouridine38-40 synthase
VQLESPIDAASLLRALNATLPDAVRVTAVDDAPADFNARFAARGKVYEYRIWNGPVVPPFERRYVWHVPPKLDLDRMHQARSALIGRHDFAAFRAAGSDVATSERTLSCLNVDAVNEKVTLMVAGDGFLRHMVRAIVGTLVDVGLGRRSIDSVAAALASRDRAQAGATAPALGLFLVKVEY